MEWNRMEQKVEICIKHEIRIVNKNQKIQLTAQTLFVKENLTKISAITKF